MHDTDDRRGIAELLSDLGSQVNGLVRREMDLARVEITSSLGRVGRGAAMAGAGAAMLYAGFLALIAAATLGLVEAGVEPWLATLLVALVMLGTGTMVTSAGVRRVQATDMAPKQTAATIRKNVEYLKEQMR